MFLITLYHVAKALILQVGACFFMHNFSGTFLLSPAVRGEEGVKGARTPRAPAGGRRPPALPAEELLRMMIAQEISPTLRRGCYKPI